MSNPVDGISRFTKDAEQLEERFLKEQTSDNALLYLGLVSNLGPSYHQPKNGSIGKALDILASSFEDSRLPLSMSTSELAVEIKKAYSFYRDIALLFGLKHRVARYERRLVH